jgi:hypothetical protein
LSADFQEAPLPPQRKDDEHDDDDDNDRSDADVHG